MQYDPSKNPERGMYYKGTGTRMPALKGYEEIRGLLPKPVLPEQEAKLWRGCYDYALQIAFGNARQPDEGSGFVSSFVDAAFNMDVFLWDTVFITMFADYLRPYLPGIAALDNFYVKQLADGEIPREMVRATGDDVPFWVNKEGLALHSYFHKKYGFRMLRKTPALSPEDMYFPDLGRPQDEVAYYTLDNLNHPLLAWGEWVSYTLTGDAARLAEVFPPLVWQYRSMRNLLRHQNGLYVTDWASMDNNPRNKYLGCGVDISCEMALFAQNLLDILGVLEESGLYPLDVELRETLQSDRAAVCEAINSRMWDEKTGFYYDLKPDGTRCGIKTAGAFWALAAGVASEEQAARLSGWLDDTNTFNRAHRVPVLAADEEGFNPNGGYWSGSVWAPMNAMVVYGLEKYGYVKQARAIAVNHMDCIAKVWEKTGTIWENYPADSVTSGDADHDEFVGWSGIGAVRFLLREALGLYPNAPANTLVWRPDNGLLAKGALGCESYRFADVCVSLTATKAGGGQLTLEIETDKPFHLVLEGETHRGSWQLQAGTHKLQCKEG